MYKYALEYAWRGFEPEEPIKVESARFGNLDALIRTLRDIHVCTDWAIIWYRTYEVVPTEVEWKLQAKHD